MLQFLAILLVLGSAAVWAAVLNRLRTGRPVLDAEPRSPARWRALDLYIILIIYLTAQLGCFYLATNLLEIDPKAAPQEPTTKTLTASLIANTLANLLVMLLSVLYLRGRCGRDVNLGFLPVRPVQDLTIGALAFAAAFAPVFAIQALVTQLIPYEHPVQDLLTKVANPRILWLCIVSAVIVAPLAEEFLFRVLLQGWMESVVMRHRLDGMNEVASVVVPPSVVDSPADTSPPASGNPYASPIEAGTLPEATSRGTRLPLMAVPIFVSSLLFAVVHFSNGPAPIPLFALALVLGYLYQKTHRIWPSVIVHACLNGWSVAALWSGQPD